MYTQTHTHIHLFILINKGTALGSYFLPLFYRLLMCLKLLTMLSHLGLKIILITLVLIFLTSFLYKNGRSEIYKSECVRINDLSATVMDSNVYF